MYYYKLDTQKMLRFNQMHGRSIELSVNETQAVSYNDGGTTVYSDSPLSVGECFSVKVTDLQKMHGSTRVRIL